MYPLRSKYRLIAALALAALCAVVGVAPAGTVEEDYAAAAQHYSQQKYAEAAAAFRKLLAAAPTHPLAGDIRFFLAESLLQTGDAEAASKEFAALVERYPQHRFAAQASFRNAESLYLRGDYAAALPKLKAFVAAQAANSLCEYALPNLGDCQLDQGHPQEAQDAYQLALKQFPNGALVGECRLGLAKAAEQQGDLADAQRFYEFLARQKELPQAADAEIQLGRLHYQQGDYAAATRLLSTLAQTKSNHPQRTAARYWYGLVLAAKNDAGGAQALWRQAIEEDAEHALAPACALALAQSLMQSDAAAAKTWCDRVGRDWPKSEYADDAAALQIELLLAERNYDAVAEAVTAFERDHARSGLLSGVRATHARALLEQGQCEQAIALLQPLTQVKSQSQWEWCYLLGLAQLGTKQFEAGLATLSKIPLKPAASGLTDVPVTSAPAASDDLRAAVLAAKGSALVALKRGAEAVAPLKQYLTDYPEGNDAAACRARLCIAYAQSGKLPQARAAWKELAAESEERTLLPTTLYLADEAAKAGDLSLARECLEFAAASDRPAEIRGQALQRLAALAQQVKSPEEAKQIGAVLKLQPKDDALAGVSLAQVQRLEREGQVDAALAAYLQWLKDYPDAGQRPLMLLSAARLHQQEQQNREALALLEEVLEKHADDRLRDAALYQIAGVLADLDRQDDAATHYAELHDKHPESSFWPDATYRLAEHRLRQKQDAEAQGLLSELIEKGKDAEIVAYALLLQGRSAAAAQKWNDVSPPLEQLLTRFPRSELRSISKYWIAESFYRRGKYAEAGRQFAELSTELDDTSEAWAPMVPLRQAQVLAHQQQWQAAHDIAAAIAKKYPTFRQQYEVDYLLGRCLGAQAKFDAAREAYQRVVQSPVGGKTETAAMAQWMIGETYFQEERFDDAISAYHRVERLHAFERWQAAALLQAGKCHETQGHYAEAIQLYAQLLKDHAKTAYAQEASQRLRVAEQRAAKNTKMK